MGITADQVYAAAPRDRQDSPWPGRTHVGLLILEYKMIASTLLATLLLADGVGQRPYELDWAGRTADHQPALVDFEIEEAWTVEASNAEATYERTRERQIWGDWVGKLTYRATGQAPLVTLRPPAPRAITPPFDALTVWVHGNNWGWAPDVATPQVGVYALLLDPQGAEVAVNMGTVNFGEWHLMHQRLTPGQQQALAGGARFAGLRIERGTNSEDRTIYVDSIVCYQEALAPLNLAPRAKRGVDPFPGQDPGQNTGAGRLPFPTREQTILPPVRAEHTTSARRVGQGAEFTYQGEDGTLTYLVGTASDGFSDISATWAGAPAFQVGVDGGVALTDAQRPTSSELVSSELAGDVLTLVWNLALDDASCQATYRYRLWGKSLVVDVEAPGGQVTEVRYGYATGLVSPKLLQIPYYNYTPGRPHIAASGTPDAPLFLAGNTDWYRSNASGLFGAGSIEEGDVTYNGGARYEPKTDGQRNDVFERLFITVSPRLDEVLPVIDNPPSVWRSVTGTGVWLAHAATDRERDSAHFRQAKQRGFDHLIITDHETMWRDHGESFTFRTRTAPGRGGDEVQERYTRLLIDELGYTYGPYNNYTDFAPVNEFWDTDHVNRLSNNQLQTAWMRCYAPKPTWSVIMCEQIAPAIQEKFHFSTAYCDVHTALAPWHRTDFDVRAPGAGTFAQTLYAWGEILMLQRQAWGGPVYSEGNHHTFLHGVVDGNYAQDQNARLPNNPWLVDFDLLRMHDLGCNFGMGYPSMFYGGGATAPGSEDPYRYLDRFIAATIAFGHPGFLVGGWDASMRNYFMVQALAAHYTQASTQSIRYFDAAGEPLETSTAAVGDALARRQLTVTYTDGTVTVVNGSETDRLQASVDGVDIDLPVMGYRGWTADGSVQVFSGDVDGQRIDYAESPEYLYIDGRGKYRRYGQAISNGPASAVRRDGGWVICLEGGAEAGFNLGGEYTATAFAADGTEVGPAEVRVSRGLSWVQRVDGALTYQLTPAGAGEVALEADRYEVTPGESVALRGAQQAAYEVPRDAVPGTHLWLEDDGRWLDFVVVRAVEVDSQVADDAVRHTLTSALPTPTFVSVDWRGAVQTVEAVPGVPVEVTFTHVAPTAEFEVVAPLRLSWAGGSQETEHLLSVVSQRVAGPVLSDTFTAGMQLRGREITTNGRLLSVHNAMMVPADTLSCGVPRERKAGELMLRAHPPYGNGTGEVFALLPPIELPAEPMTIAGEVGKMDGSDPGDGILYRVAVIDGQGQEHRLAAQIVTQHEWLPLEADLSRWAGQTVRIKLITDPGLDDETSGDWACWAGWRLLSQREIPRYDLSLYDRGPTAAPPFPLAGLRISDLKTATGARLHFGGFGLHANDQYHQVVEINGYECGRAPAANGDEQWAVFENVTMDLPAEVANVLRARNELVFRNPRRDYYAAQDPWLELLLADGRRVSTRVAKQTFSQPPEWANAVGRGVPFGQNLSWDLWFDVAME